ncbi:PhoPQ-regulated protein [Xanthomonas vesicatoria ATCC 35937]|uniref:PhoPQ-activated pathogenicity-related protein n=1 Tax=Xanthomonas vesicatoria ATCC 35937 TaxID=925775 RepID=F0B8J5_9XANT|nr:PhoPQ-activated protein PqaA family protein [Xanthomonas vesicatoria]APP74951.1 PhoPQ-regulated protein [Xanthomonas vesicatoria ATCC 35937]EGD11321.1 PhoPQ-activated pathogenicity-related protein [Xanthomonas vesicatoria ATCC 35937]KTF31011.1 PhoPQ-regulated protein [Xanthomonas vesicatoria]MCC8596401.1 PhoPQ-regulated protein [Xanthomonas vesicatoria]MCC8606736.1 PhoPQ-regulated protein [Xanthomonas vesicatoria]
MRLMTRCGIALLALIAGPALASTAAERCATAPEVGFDQALVCYRDAVEQQPPVYTRGATSRIAGVERREYLLTSQSWSPEGLVTPATWQHDVAMYVPADALPTRALLISTNGTRHPVAGSAAQPASELPPEALAALAQSSRTVVIALSDIPNQALQYRGDAAPRREDDSVAYSWSLFLQSPQQRKIMPLHVPMAAAIARTMSLAERELAPLQIHRFILAGASKRGWASWHATIADPRVDAVVPFVIDILNMPAVLDHMYRAYGGNWPIAFNAYAKQGITAQLQTPAFAQLVQLQDPLSYRRTPYRKRLMVPKYIVNASGDDFFLPDNTRFFYDALPGSKALRMVPNSAHNGIRTSVVDALVPFITRLQQQRSLPKVSDTLREGDAPQIHFRSSERPTQLRLWAATNPQARDFRYACGIRYQATPVALVRGDSVSVPVQTPDIGWSAYFVEATYADGFVATSQTYVLGKQQYPSKAPPTDNAACSTLPGMASSAATR